MIYFISGPLDLTQEEFNMHYLPSIDKAIEEGASFVIGDANGCDFLAQLYLSNKDTKFTVYHMFDKPRHCLSEDKKGGFESDEERDSQMTKNSQADILYIRTPEDMKKRLGKKYKPNYINGTMKNKLRRFN